MLSLPVVRRTGTIILWALALTLVLAGCGDLRPASTLLIETAAAEWQAHTVTDYQVVVDIQRPEARDSFRAEVQVRDGRIVVGTLRYRESGAWGSALTLSETQSIPYTVPGLFNIVRSELANSGRRSIEVELDATYAFPRRLVLGPVYQDGRAVTGTETTVRVRQFEVLNGR